MKCPICNAGEMTERIVEEYSYAECGLANVTLRHILVQRCVSCGLDFPSIPGMEKLHREIAIALVRKEERLTPAEIKYLRKSLGWSSSDFAHKMHTNLSQVSRWENGHVQMSIANELLLRSLVALGQKIGDYRTEDAAHIATARPRALALYRDKDEWRQAA